MFGETSSVPLAGLRKRSLCASEEYECFRSESRNQARRGSSSCAHLPRGGERMRSGTLLCLCGALSFGLLASVSKVAERRKCDTSTLIVWIFGWASLFMFGESLTLPGKIHITWPVIALAIVLGICAAVAYFAFQTSITSGKVTVGWLMMNLSAGVPAIVSIWIYREKLTLLKSIAFVLAFVSLLCLFQGHRLEARASIRGEVK